MGKEKEILEPHGIVGERMSDKSWQQDDCGTKAWETVRRGESHTLWCLQYAKADGPQACRLRKSTASETHRSITLLASD
jgi:hypothetical protein